MARLLCVKTARGGCLNWPTWQENKQHHQNLVLHSSAQHFLFSTAAFLSIKAQRRSPWPSCSHQCSHLSTRVVPFKEQGLPTFSFPVHHCTWDWSPLTFYHFLLIDWVQDSHLFSDSIWESFSQGSRWLLGALRESASLGSNRVCYVCY